MLLLLLLVLWLLWFLLLLLLLSLLLVLLWLLTGRQGIRDNVEWVSSLRILGMGSGVRCWRFGRDGVRCGG